LRKIAPGSSVWYDDGLGDRRFGVDESKRDEHEGTEDEARTVNVEPDEDDEPDFEAHAQFFRRPAE